VVNECVETLCRNGCDAVRTAITAMERGAPVPGTEKLDAAARAAVLAELKTIMAVYDQS
jgi:hypothetical protein